MSAWLAAKNPSEAAPHNLFAQELARERPHTEDVRHVVRVPTLCEHRYGDHTADMLAQIAALTDGIDNLAQRLARLVLGLALLGLDLLE